MRLIFLESNQPHLNLASEEYLLKNSSEACFILWRNADAVIVGRNQNTLAEINYEAVKEKGISVVRRMSGGGAVFHDLGNLNYTFIMKNDGNDFNNYAKFCAPIVEALNALGVNARLSGRNDLLIDDRKFSGNAQYVYKDKILHHGCILFSTDMGRLGQVLRVNPKKIKSKGIGSVRSRVTNITEHLKEPMDVLEFKDYLFSFVKNKFPEARFWELTEEDLREIRKLCDEKYATWEWNFGYSPKYTLKREHYLAAGTIDVNLNIKDGIINKARIWGDFFGRREIGELEERLIGVKHKEDELGRVLSQLEIGEYISGVDLDELIGCFF